MCYFRNHNAKIVPAENAMSCFVPFCPAMSRYVLIKTKKTGKYLCEW